MENIESWTGRFISSETEVEGLASRFDRDDVLFGKLRPYLAKVYKAEISGICSTEFLIYRTGKGYDSSFLQFLMRCHSFINLVDSSTYGSKMPRANSEFIGNQLIPVPSLAEQTAIANFLDRKTAQIDQAISIKEKQIELLKERRQILIHNAVTRGLDPDVKMKDSGVEWIGEIPEHWGISKLSYLSIIGNGSTPSRSNLNYWENGTFPWLNSSKVNDEKIEEADQFITLRALNECHLPILEPGTIVIAITGEGKTRGMVAMCNILATINQHLAYIKLTSSKLESYFLLEYLRAMYINIRADSSGLGSTKGAITCAGIKTYYVPIPPIIEQILIIGEIKKISEKIATAISLKQKEIEKLKEYKSTLINSAVTGKIKV
jgi:type I restriction enzyme, S subunit